MVIQSLNFLLNGPAVRVALFFAGLTFFFLILEKVCFFISKGFWSSVSDLEVELADFSIGIIGGSGTLRVLTSNGVDGVVAGLVAGDSSGESVVVESLLLSVFSLRGGIRLGNSKGLLPFWA